MKTKSLFFAAFVALSSTAFAFGSDEPGMTVVSARGSEIFKVIYKGASAGKVRINVLDDKGKTIHSETVAGLDGFICPLNFKGLESGNYTIELVDGAGRYQEAVSYKPVQDLKAIHISKLIREEGKFLLALENVKDEPIRVRILDGQQREIYNEVKNISGNFAQVYALGKNIGCTFVVSDAAGNAKYFQF